MMHPETIVHNTTRECERRYEDYDRHNRVISFFHTVHGWNAWVGIHSVLFGRAMGGCRFWPYIEENKDNSLAARKERAVTDVLRLSRGMTFKAALLGDAGIEFDGGKMVTLGNSSQEKSNERLRWLGLCVEYLGGAYLTGEDIGMSPADVDRMAEVTDYALGTSKSKGGSGDPSAMTARGVSGSIFSLAERFGYGKGTAAIQGIGNVGSKVAVSLYEAGFDLIVADVVPGKAEAFASAYPGMRVEDYHLIHMAEADFFVPCACGGILNEVTIPQLRARAVVGSANNQLDHIKKDGLRLHQRGVLYAPDYVANGGGLANVTQETNPLGYCVERVFALVDQIPNTVCAILERSIREDRPASEVADMIAEERLAMRRALLAKK